MNYEYSNVLMHHGVKGMRWGVRKDKYNSGYSADQRARDKAVYGRGGVRRINRRMNKGQTISGARSSEANRIYRARRAAITTGNAGHMVGTFGGALAGYKLANKVLAKYGTGDFMTDTIIRSAIMTGTASIGSTLGRSGGKSVAMLAGGYSPSKFRYG